MAESRTWWPMGPPWAGRRGFGCAFAFIFVFVVGSLVATMAVVVSHLGALPGLVVLAVVVAVVVGMGRGLPDRPHARRTRRSDPQGPGRRLHDVSAVVVGRTAVSGRSAS